MKYDAVIFDLDGTLLNTLADLASSVNHALNEYGMPQRSVDQVREFVGNGVRKLIERAVPDNTDTDVTDKVFENFKNYYAEHCRDCTRPYAGIMDLLKNLKFQNIGTAIVSNKADFAVKKLSDSYFGTLIDVAIGEREGVRKKPAPDSLVEAVRVLNAKTPVYVGDSDVDVLTAKNAGLPGAFVTWGFRTAGVLIGAGAKENRIVNSAAELYDLLERD